MEQERTDFYTYEELFNEALSSIPLYTKEWTNYNQSDPGITILQNFAAFQVLLQEKTGQVSEEGERRLLRLLGIEAKRNKGCRFLLAPAAGSLREPVSFAAHQKIYMGEVCVEPTAAGQLVPSMLRNVWTESREGKKDVTRLLDPSVAAGAPVFGSEPAEGAAIYFAFDCLPVEDGKICLYMDVKGDVKRTPFEAGHVPEFAVLSWQCLMEDGWMELSAEDETAYFLRSGMVRLSLPAHGSALGQLRCVLLRSQYDEPPVLNAVYDSMLEVEQRYTAAAHFLLEGERVTVESSLVGDECYDVFCREEPKGGYRRYRAGIGPGRYYTMEERSDDRLTLTFDREACGYGPCGEKDSILVVCYAKEMMYHRGIGSVYGYDDQILTLEQIQNVAGDGFAVLVETEDAMGEPMYSLSYPGEQGEDSLGYELLEEEGAVHIQRPGKEEGCRLYLSSCATTEGRRWQVRPGSSFSFNGAAMTCLPAIREGTSRENVEDLKEYCYEGRKQLSAAVTAADYEELVRHTPGLCIDQVKAWAAPGSHLVEISVKPASSSRRPMLSELYRDTILEYLKERRLMTTRIVLHGPKYVPLYVRGTVYIKSRFYGSENAVREALKVNIAGLAGEAGFGGMISGDELIKGLLRLPGVDHVYELQIRPAPGSHAHVRGSDIIFDNRSIGYFAGESLVFMTKT